MIRKLLLGTVAVTAMATSAFAADLPSRRAPPVYIPPPIPVFSWTGFYLGGQVGYAFGGSGAGDSVTARAGGATARFSEGFSNGIIGGAHIGYNFSTQSLGAFPLLGTGLGALSGGFGGGGLVFGVEGDVDGTDYRSQTTIAGATFTNRTEIEGSARGRLGIAVDRALFYATGGAAFAQFMNGYATPALGGVTLSSTRVGYTVGGGIEYAITTQWSLRAEYRYSDFGSYTQVPIAGVSFQHKQIQQRAQVGFSYKFDTPVAPVVARY